MDKTDDPVWITKTTVIWLDKDTKNIHWKKTASLTNSSRKSGCLYVKEWNRSHIYYFIWKSTPNDQMPQYEIINVYIDRRK